MNENCLDLLPVCMCVSIVMLNMNCGNDSSQKNSTSFQFSSDFESGAATDFHIQNDGTIGFSIPKELGGDEYLWFYFKVVNDGTKLLWFTVENAEEAHQTGWRWKITRPVFSTDGKTWIRAKNVQYSYLRHRLWQRGIKLFGKPVFRFQAPVKAETLWVAYCYPYTNKDLNTLLEQMRTSPEVAISSIGKSEEGRDIPKIEIGQVGAAEGRKPQQIWVICREHPGETPASYVCEGFMQALLEHPAGKQLHDVYGFSIIPILNVDGVARGCYYHDAKGIDLAFDWKDFKSAETRAVRDALEDDMKKNGVRLMLNFHSSNDPTKGHYFLEMAESKLKPGDVAFQRSIFQAANRTNSQLQGYATVKLWDFPGITGNALYNKYGVYCLYLESSYSRAADGSVITQESLRKTGAALVEALAQVLVSEK